MKEWEIVATRVDGHTLSLEKREPKVMIMSRTHDQDVSGAIINVHPSHAMSMSAHRFQEAWSQLEMDKTYTVSDSNGNTWQGMHVIPPEVIAERELLLAYIPWLDGAREALMNIETCLHGL